MFIKGLSFLVIMITPGVSLVKTRLLQRNSQNSIKYLSNQPTIQQSLQPSSPKPSIPLPFATSKNPHAQTVAKEQEFGHQILTAHFPLSIYPENIDQQVIEQRQISRSSVGLFAVENTRCKYGFPQAYVQYPVGNGVSSGMIRLSCPHLVKAGGRYIYM